MCEFPSETAEAYFPCLMLIGELMPIDFFGLMAALEPYQYEQAGRKPQEWPSVLFFITASGLAEQQAGAQ